MRWLTAIVATVAALSPAACSGDDDSSGRTAITVFAAASLTDAFTEIADQFEEANPGVTVELSFAGSSSLREQILEGAPADVFASASESNMDQVVEAGEVDRAETFATNRLQIVVPAGNPAGIAGLEDFSRDELLIGLCAEEVPCGDFGRQVLAAAGVEPATDTNEADVRALLTKVEAGELDAGLVYVTDVVSAGDAVEGIDLPDEVDVLVSYPIGPVTSTGNPDVARAFVDFVLGDQGRAVLGDSGFGLP